MNYHQKFLLTIFVLVFALEYILTTQVIFSLKSFLSIHSQSSEDLRSEKHLLLNLFLNGLTFPNSMMIIPIVAGIVCDAIGALNFQLGSFIIFNIGALIAGICSITIEGQTISFHKTMVIQIGIFLIGASYQCVKIGVIVCIANSFIYRPKNDIQLCIYALAGYTVADSIGSLLGFTIANYGSRLFSWTWIFLPAWILTIFTMGLLIWILRENKTMMKSFRQVQLSWKTWTNKVVDVDNRAETWADRNDILKDKDDNNLSELFKRLGIIKIMAVIGLGYLLGANEITFYAPPFLLQEGVLGELIPYIMGLVRLVAAFAFIKISWTKYKTIAVNVLLFIVLVFATWQAFLPENIPEMPAQVIVLFAIFRSIIMELFILNLLYILEFDITHAGKIFGCALWCVSAFMTCNIVFFYWWIPLIALALYTPYVIVEIRRFGKDEIFHSEISEIYRGVSISSNFNSSESINLNEKERKGSTFAGTFNVK